MRKLQFLFLTFLISVQLLAQKTDSTFKKPEKESVLEKKGYVITIPKGWKIQENCKEELCNLVAPFDTLGILDTFLESINFTVNQLPSASYTVDEYARFSIKYLPSVVKNFSIVDRKKIKSNAFRLTYKGEKDKFKQTWRQYYFVKNSKVYIMTFACETEKYTYYQPMIEPYLNSFRLK